MRRILWLLPVLAMLCGWASATTRYIATSSGTFTGGTACNGQTAITAASFNAITNSPGDINYICGTLTGTAGATILTVTGSGTSSSPVTINFDTGSILQAPYCGPSNGCLDIHGLSWIVVNGLNAGTIQNTANGDGLANQHISIGLFASPCTNCTIENLTVANMYIAIQNFATPLGGSATQINAIYMTGQNNTITGNTIHDCGWCLYIPYGSGDTNLQVTNNEIYHWDHAMMFAAPGAISCSAPCLFLEGNRIHDNVNWETAGCVYHLDGLHTFGVSGSTMNGIYIANNYFYGSLSGACSSGFLFMEQGSPSMSNASNTYIWNNVFDASNADGVNPNGWVGVFSGVGGVTQVMSNTLLCPSSTDGGTVGWSVQQQGANITFEDNLENKCPQGNNLSKGSGTLTMDYNAYGNPCNGTSNCWVNPSGVTFQGSFSAWKTACSCDSHSFTTATDAAMKVNSDGSLQSGSPAIEQGVNLTSLGTGNLTSLLSDTTKGTTRSAGGRPSGTCTVQGAASCWDEGAYNFGTPTVATPTFSPVAGTYTSTQSVTISSATGGATLCYTIDGTTPTANGTGTCTHGTTYTTAVSVAVPETLKAIGSLSGDSDSAVGSAAYVITVVPPTFSPVAGIYTSTQSVTISTTTGGATLCYTIDGTTPTANGAGTCTHGTTYSGAVSVSVSLTLKAIGSISGLSDSAVTSGAYTIAPVIATPTFSPVAGTYALAQSVTISSSTGGATLCYTSDGTTPTGNGAGTCTHGTTYSSAVTVAFNLTLKAIGTESGFTDSTVGSATYLISPPPAPCNACMASLPKVIPSTTTAQVDWETVVPTTATVKYGLTLGYGRKILESSGYVLDHSFQLVKLKPSTTYHLQLLGQDDDGNIVTSPDKVFATQ